MNNEKLTKLVDEVKTAMGGHLKGTVGPTGGQFAFCTDEPDRGELVRGEWMDTVEMAVDHAGIRHAAVMPFPVNGMLTYVVAGV